MADFQSTQNNIETIYILCDKGKIGTLRQCEAITCRLKKYFNCHVTVIDVDLPFYLSIIPAFLSRYLPLSLFSLSKQIINPKKSFLIAGGHQSTIIAAPLAKYSPTVVLLNPKCPSSYFKAVIVPRHDQISTKNKNVIETTGTLHPHNADSFKIQSGKSDSYTISVLLGGNSKHYIFKDHDYIKIGKYLKEKSKKNKNLQILVSPSRRSQKQGVDLIKKELYRINATFWDGTGDNPYFEYLSQANEILVTADSISMISEACYLGKPVEIWPLPIKNNRLLRFYENLIQEKNAVFASQKWPDSFIPLRECERVFPLLINIHKLAT